MGRQPVRHHVAQGGRVVAEGGAVDIMAGGG